MATPVGLIENDGSWYDPSGGTYGELPKPQQPNGQGTPVTLPLQQPNKYFVSNGIPTNIPPNEKDGAIFSPCGHSLVFWAFKPTTVNGVASNLQLCPVCGYCVAVITPASDVFNYQNFYSV